MCVRVRLMLRCEGRPRFWMEGEGEVDMRSLSSSSSAFLFRPDMLFC